MLLSRIQGSLTNWDDPASIEGFLTIGFPYSNKAGYNTLISEGGTLGGWLVD